VRKHSEDRPPGVAATPKHQRVAPTRGAQPAASRKLYRPEGRSVAVWPAPSGGVAGLSPQGCAQRKNKGGKGGRGGRNNERGWRRGKEHQARRGWRNESRRRRSDGADTVTARARRRWTAAATGRGGPWMQCVLRLCSPEGTVSAAATRAVAPSHTGYMRYPDLGTAWRARLSI